MLWKDRTPEEIDATIEKIADWVVENEMEVPALLFFESIKPLAPIGARMGGAMFSGLIPIIGYGVDDHFVAFRETKNIEKVVKLIEEKSEVRDQAKKTEKQKNKRRRRRRMKTTRKTLEDSDKKPWYWPF